MKKEKKLEKVTPKNLPGFKELLPSKQIVFENIVNSMKHVYEKYGFFPLDTPILEHSEILLAKAGGETEKQIYRFTKGKTDMTMRFDLTVPVAKYVAMNYNSLAFPFKRYQIGKVYRGERAQRGRYREFYQADIDVIGNGSLNYVYDAEITSIIYEIFKGLGLFDFTIRINNRKILSGFFSILSLSDKCDDIMRIIDKISKIGLEKTKNELAILGLSISQIESILEFVCFDGTIEEKLNSTNAYLNMDKEFDIGINELKQVLYYIDAFGVPCKNYTVDFSIARGLDYYTGTIYETTVNTYPEIGSVCSGGRYDNLAECYCDRKLPGVGISIGITRLFDVLESMENSIFEKDFPVDVLIIPMNVELFRKAIDISRLIQAGGINTQVYFETVKLGKGLKYANKLKAPFVVIIGEDELLQDKIRLKRLSDGYQTTVNSNEAIKIINNNP